MTFSIVGDRVRDTSTGQFIDKGSGFPDAIRVGQDRSKSKTRKSSGGAPVSTEPTARLLIAFSFADAKTYWTRVDPEAEKSRALAEATDPKVIAEYLRMTPDQWRQRGQVAVRAKQAPEEVQDDSGAWHPAGSWVVRTADGLAVLSGAEFSAAYADKKAADELGTKSKKGGS